MKRMIITFAILLIAASILSTTGTPLGEAVAPLMPVVSNLGNHAAQGLLTTAAALGDFATNLVSNGPGKAVTFAADNIKSAYAGLTPVQHGILTGGGIAYAGLVASLVFYKFSLLRLVMGSIAIISMLTYALMHFK